MKQLNVFSDKRLINGCIYCGGPAETRDHIPSRILLEKPYPENLPVIGCCRSCNEGFSKDEQYLVCLIESALVGTADPKKVRRPSVARTLERSPALRDKIEKSKTIVRGRTVFVSEESRVQNVMLKLARGHAAFELSQPCKEAPNYFWCGPLEGISQEQHEAFEAPHIQQTFGEVGSKGLQRMLVMEIGENSKVGLLLNDWVDVQDGYYRYFAVDEIGGIVIRIVVAEYIGCEVMWAPNRATSKEAESGSRGF